MNENEVSFLQFISELLPENTDVKSIHYSTHKQKWYVNYNGDEPLSEHENFFQLIAHLAFQRPGFFPEQLPL